MSLCHPHHIPKPFDEMTIKSFLKTLDDANRVLEKLGKIAITVFQLALLIYDLYKFVAH